MTTKEIHIREAIEYAFDNNVVLIAAAAVIIIDEAVPSENRQTIAWRGLQNAI